VRIKRRDGSEHVVRAVDRKGSPLNVPGVDTDLSQEEILAAIRESREGEPHRGVAPLVYLLAKSSNRSR
jgi:hypothetical protein